MADNDNNALTQNRFNRYLEKGKILQHEGKYEWSSQVDKSRNAMDAMRIALAEVARHAKKNGMSRAELKTLIKDAKAEFKTGIGEKFNSQAVFEQGARDSLANQVRGMRKDPSMTREAIKQHIANQKMSIDLTKQDIRMEGGVEDKYGRPYVKKESPSLETAGLLKPKWTNPETAGINEPVHAVEGAVVASKSGAKVEQEIDKIKEIIPEFEEENESLDDIKELLEAIKENTEGFKDKDGKQIIAPKNLDAAAMRPILETIRGKQAINKELQAMRDKRKAAKERDELFIGKAEEKYGIGGNLAARGVIAAREYAKVSPTVNMVKGGLWLAKHAITGGMKAGKWLGNKLKEKHESLTKNDGEGIDYASAVGRPAAEKSGEIISPSPEAAAPSAPHPLTGVEWWKSKVDQPSAVEAMTPVITPTVSPTNISNVTHASNDEWTNEFNSVAANDALALEEKEKSVAQSQEATIVKIDKGSIDEFRDIAMDVEAESEAFEEKQAQNAEAAKLEQSREAAEAPKTEGKKQTILEKAKEKGTSILDKFKDMMPKMPKMPDIPVPSLPIPKVPVGAVAGALPMLAAGAAAAAGVAGVTQAIFGKDGIAKGGTGNNFISDLAGTSAKMENMTPDAKDGVIDMAEVKRQKEAAKIAREKAANVAKIESVSPSTKDGVPDTAEVKRQKEAAKVEPAAKGETKMAMAEKAVEKVSESSEKIKETKENSKTAAVVSAIAASNKGGGTTVVNNGGKGGSQTAAVPSRNAESSFQRFLDTRMVYVA